MTTMSASDRLSRWWYLTRVSWTARDLPTKDWKSIRAGLSQDIADAAGVVGMHQALSDLGPSSQLAYRYIEARGRRLPRWTSGALWAGLFLYVWVALIFAYAFGLADGSGDAGVARSATHVMLGVALIAENTPDLFAIGFGYSPWLWLMIALLVVAFLVGARSWRVLRRP